MWDELKKYITELEDYRILYDYDGGTVIDRITDKMEELEKDDKFKS